MRLLDNELFPGLGLVFFGKSLIESLIKFARWIVGDVEQDRVSQCSGWGRNKSRLKCIGR